MSSLAASVAASLRAHSGSEAIVTPRGRWTYNDLEVEIADAAATLKASGANSVALLAHESAATIFWLLAAIAHGIPVAVCPPHDDSALAMFQPDLVVGAVSYAPALFRQRPRVRTTPAATVCVFTAGTDGQPKGVVHTADSLASAVTQLRLLRHEVLGQPAAFPAEPGIFLQQAASEPAVGLTYLGVMPVWTIAGLTVALQAIIGGDRLICLEPKDPSQTLQLIDEFSVTNLSLTPFLAQMLNRHLRSHTPNTRALVHVGIGGGPTPTAVAAELEGLLNAPVTVGYGATEAAGPLSIGRITDAPSIRHGTIGRPLPGVSARVVDNELIVRARSLALGYLADGAPLRRLPIVDGWWHTGDLASIEPSGAMHVHGRRDDVILRGGHRIDPARLERVMEMHPAVTHAGVIGMPSRVAGEQDVCALLVCNDNLSRRSLLRHCSDAGQIAPQRVYRVHSLPLTADGIPKRRELPHMMTTAAVLP